MISRCEPKDFKEIYDIINDSASVYRGVIPEDRWHDPYMPEQELRKQIEEGVEFWCYKENETILAVMGIQFKGDVTLIRHAYVRSAHKSKGIGGKLLEHLESIAETPVLIGTWADAEWAIRFYQKHGYRLLSSDEKNSLLRKYWSIPERQADTSVVLANSHYQNNQTSNP